MNGKSGIGSFLIGIEEIIYKDKKERRKKGVGKGVKNETSNTL